MFKPSLTTVNQNIHNIGARSIEHLISMIENPEYSPPEIMEPASLVIRQSTGKVKVSEDQSR